MKRFTDWTCHVFVTRESLSIWPLWHTVCSFCVMFCSMLYGQSVMFRCAALLIVCLLNNRCMCTINCKIPPHIQVRMLIWNNIHYPSDCKILVNGPKCPYKSSSGFQWCKDWLNGRGRTRRIFTRCMFIFWRHQITKNSSSFWYEVVGNL